MAFLCRIRQTKLNYLCSQLNRSYFQISAPCLSDYVAQENVPSSSSHRMSYDLLGRPNEVFYNVRFFAAPVQVKKKVEETSSKGPRLNEQIKAHMVRLVSDEGHDIVPLRVAMEQAKRLKLDLVEVDRNAKPAVCKIMDYHKEKYKQHLKEKERSKSKAELTVRKGSCKEVRFSPKTEQKDLQMKADMAKRLMERGYRVKCMVIGSEDQDLGGLINRLHALIEDVALVESGPRVERKQAYIIVRHIKFGPSKKGAKGTAKSAEAARLELQKDTTSQPNSGSSSPIQHPADFELRASEDSGSENDYDETFPEESDSQSTPEDDKTNWSFDANDAHEKVFHFSEDVKTADSFSDQQMGSVPKLDSVPQNADLSSREMPQVPNFTGSNANLSENRYIRQGSTTRDLTGAERYMQPGPDPPQMPPVPNFKGSSANSSENRYSRQGLTRRGLPVAEQYMQPGPRAKQYVQSGPRAEQFVQPGPGPKSYMPPPQREIPKQKPSTSDCVSTPKSYGIFSNPKVKSP